MALSWHPDHLSAALRGLRPPEPGDPRLLATDEDVPARLAVKEHHLRQIASQLGGIDGINERFDELNVNLSAAIRQTNR